MISIIKKTPYYPFTILLSLLVYGACQPASTTEAVQQEEPQPKVEEPSIFEEVDGVLAVEAEHFVDQTDTLVRKWYIVEKETSSLPTPDPDENHAATASGGVYLEALPDTRTTHDDGLTEGENFFPEPNQAGILNYRVYFNTPGKYYVWARTHSTGTEDNGIHVGLDGEWPENGKRMQFHAHNDKWTWESRQRTEEVHSGVPEQIYLMIEEPGEHTVSFSMREDGFEFDKWAMTLAYEAPEGIGPEANIYNK
ncbi:hypothetical protein [Tunicatimonas pelagia]|uniref:hypothetical protein n=1 Tax=Tunicatimonas pelagia TaxID=931531 RepID=UPI002666AB65|nr:hypothetical protein [Tunicatimonas pelagia]WKN46261.1 hypothetical protein P0M28_15015 [Tunicatimonas pelagia]